MTNQEVIEILKIERDHMIPTLLPERIEAMDLAISTLEKQIPKKPNKIQSKNSENLWDLYCPSCENWIGMWNSRLKRGRWNSRLKRGSMYNIANENICPYCGQILNATQI